MTLSELHRDRARAESFGRFADDYERHRPDFPGALFDDLAALGATRALDVGCGTGKVARGLAARGLAVLGVEVDPRMAVAARARGVEVEVARFEEWDDAGRRFDLVACGDAWHWIDPRRGAAQLARVLPPGGIFAGFWNMQLLDGPVARALEAVYGRHAPRIHVYGRAPAASEVEAGLRDDPFALEGPFARIGSRTYLSERRVTAAEWVAYTATISDVRRLPPDRLDALLAAIPAALEPFGETLRIRVGTTAILERRD